MAIIKSKRVDYNPPHTCYIQLDMEVPGGEFVRHWPSVIILYSKIAPIPISYQNDDKKMQEKEEVYHRYFQHHYAHLITRVNKIQAEGKLYPKDKKVMMVQIETDDGEVISVPVTPKIVIKGYDIITRRRDSTIKISKESADFINALKNFEPK